MILSLMRSSAVVLLLLLPLPIQKLMARTVTEQMTCRLMSYCKRLRHHLYLS
ncbi:unnamed protein product [Gongylonema pulchrum]|uniref:Uncharacterized protein n=1 Tax=Gongylonema pulchrum TaxID=637853 RepID=A0A3P7RGT7_9BILA|nr:unnamed protein product [Gongylonema pulchrum]